MMISPEVYMEQLKDAPYAKLIQERDQLIENIRKFEKAELAGDRSDPEWKYSPSPEVRYQMHLEYLSALCRFMHDKYNQEYVWGGRRLKQDADDSCGKKTGAVDTRKAEQNFNATLELLKGIYKPESK